MNPVAAKQVALDNDLVPPEKRLKIEKCNARIEFSKPQREETYQVTLDALKLSPCYPAFLITTEVLEFVMTLLGTLKFVLKTQDYQQYGALIPDEMINQDIKDSKAYKTYLDFATGKETLKKTRKFKKVALPLRKLSHVLEEEHVKKPKRAKKPAKKSTTVPTAGVVIRDTPTLLEAAQLKKTLKKSNLKTHKLHASGLGDGVGSKPKVPDEQEDKTIGTDEGTSTKPRVPDVPKYLSESKNESWGDSGDDDDNDDDSDKVTKDDDDDVDNDADGDKEASESEKTDSDKDKNPNLNQNDDEEGEHEEEYVRTPDSVEFTDDDEEYEELYKDVNVRLQATEHEEEGKRDEEMTDDGTQQTTYEQVKDDEHVILTTVHDAQKTEVPLQSSSVSSDFANQFLTLDNVPPTNTEVVSMMNVKKAKDESKRYIDLVEKSVKDIIKDEVKSQLYQILPKEVSEYATPMIQSSITESLENIVLAKSSSQPKSTYEAATSLTEFELKKILLDKIQKSKSYQGAQEHKDLYDSLVKSYKLEKDLFESYGKSSSSKGSKSQPKSSGKFAQAKEPVFEAANTKMPLNRGDDLGNTDDQPNVEADSKDDWFKKPKRPLTPDSAKKPPLTFDELMRTPIDFSAYVMNNLKIENLTQEYLVGPAFNLVKGTCKSRVELEYHFEECYKLQGRQVGHANYFINNDLEYLKGGSLSRKYTTSTTKTKAAKESLTRVQNDNGSIDTEATGSPSMMYLEEIEFRREDQQLYKFREGDFPRLNLSDIEDMLLLLVQKKLSNLERDVIYDLSVALQMFTRRVFILKRVEDLQLGVESYQKKLNITKPETFRSDITNMTPYTAYNNPQGIIYLEKFKRNRFCDGTLTFVRRVLHDIASSLEMDYLPKRRWSKLDGKRSCIKIKAIDQQLFERRVMRNLVKFVGRREYEKTSGCLNGQYDFVIFCTTLF
ncbi:hypothetical protein Tco_0993901 [Tanacetum coccineum]